MPFERRLTSILTTICLVALPGLAAILYLPHRVAIDYSVVMLSLVTIGVMVIVMNLMNIFPARGGKLFPSIPQFFLGLIPFYFVICVLVFYTGGLASSFYYLLLVGPLVAGTLFNLSFSMASTTILASFYLAVIFSYSHAVVEDLQPLAFNLIYLFFACFIANRIAQELKRQQRSRDEVRSLSGFIHQVDQAKTEFISTVSHELRTPLTSIQGFSEMLRSWDLEPEKRREFHEIILNESERLSRMITNLLNLSLIEAGGELNKEMVDIGQVIEENITFFRTQTDRHTLTYKERKRLPLVYADRDRVHQIMQNLISNAVKYSPEGGPIEIDTGIEGKFMRISVTDHGLGIREQDLQSIFERFRRSEDSAVAEISGTGLGLAIVKHLADMHAGRVRVASEYGRGSTFSVLLPIKGS